MNFASYLNLALIIVSHLVIANRDIGSKLDLRSKDSQRHIQFREAFHTCRTTNHRAPFKSSLSERYFRVFPEAATSTEKISSNIPEPQ